MDKKDANEKEKYLTALSRDLFDYIRDISIKRTIIERKHYSMNKVINEMLRAQMEQEQQKFANIHNTQE